MVTLETNYGMKILLGQQRAETIARALEKILTPQNFDIKELTVGETNDLNLLLEGIKEHIK